MKKLLFYSHDSYGLGNIRRMVAIANYLVSQHQDLYILLITGSPMLHAFRTHPQIDYIKLPCLHRSQAGEYHAKLNCFSVKSLLRLRSQMIKDAITQFYPNLLLVDKKPEGLNGELNETLEQICTQPYRPALVLLLRDILDTPEETQTIWAKNKYYQRIERDYDAVAVVGEQTIFDLPKHYNFPSDVASKTFFCGYLERMKSNRSKNNIRDKLHIPSTKQIIVVSAGGGNDGKNIITAYLEGLKKHAAYSHLIHSIIFYGPEMSSKDCDELHGLAHGIESLTLAEFTDDFISYLSTADLVISMGGYNTVCEILSLNKPAVIIPRVEPVKEQLIRAECFHKLNIFNYIHPNDLSAQSLIECISHTLFTDTPLNYSNEVDLQGMKKLEQKLLSLINKH
ncbi:hypothetical protein KP803_02385 [Vibrio sp. ZSDE26]|uniref:Glycosyl transferase family 28 C-terminal domain-containing protein n=1 Tax=Vibrio amylolyticus TaxID=2847292 RepID=A0A9X1XM95_9VIBR|nr:glycosyltransferase [Vibrio amylolyticus]MCK6262119.1 hypothetical protein [Vibrio amylolyticus]